MAEKKKSDPAMTKIRAVFAESGLSLVELGKRMGYPDEMARQAAWQFMKSGDPRMSMLRKFAEAMEISVDDLTPRRKRMSRKLDAELTECGCTIPPDHFREMLEEKKALMFPSWTIDDMVCHPEEAMQFCAMIRKISTCGKLDDFLILRTLMNARRSH